MAAVSSAARNTTGIDVIMGGHNHVVVNPPQELQDCQADGLQPGTAHRRVVRLPDGALLNRYWDDRDTPREESWREDVATAGRSDRPAAA